jgi:glucose-1-phosphate thymidylyltransferase
MSNNIKGIILAGGKGTRLHPVTIPTCKQLLPVYDKPMIYYPLSVLMLAGIKNILIICNPEDLTKFDKLLGNGKEYGISISYSIQVKPKGLADAFIIGEEFIGRSNVCLILGDNLFYGQSFTQLLTETSRLIQSNGGSTVFAYPVSNPKEFGIIEFDSNKTPISIAEKPMNPRSKYAITGLYFYDNDVVKIAKAVNPSDRGELEITDINKIYLKEKKLSVQFLGRGFTWLDTGNADSLLEASKFVQTIEKRQGLKIACLEEIAWRKGWISDNDLVKVAKKHNKTSYGKYLNSLLEEYL